MALELFSCEHLCHSRDLLLGRSPLSCKEAVLFHKISQREQSLNSIFDGALFCGQGLPGLHCKRFSKQQGQEMWIRDNLALQTAQANQERSREKEMGRAKQ